MTATLILKNNTDVKEPLHFQLTLKDNSKVDLLCPEARIRKNPKTTHIMANSLQFKDPKQPSILLPYVTLDYVKRQVKYIQQADKPQHLVSCIFAEEQPDKRKICYGIETR